MSDISPVRRNIQVEETQFRAAVSEAVAQKIGSSVNFINDFQHSEKQFFVNGNYSLITLPFNEIDGFTFFQYNSQIIDVWMYTQGTGVSGTTELDIQYATTPGGSFATIFSTTPKITSAAGTNIWIHVGSAVSGTTAPVISVSSMAAGSALRLNIVQSQTGPGLTGTGIVVHYLPV